MTLSRLSKAIGKRLIPLQVLGCTRDGASTQRQKNWLSDTRSSAAVASFIPTVSSPAFAYDATRDTQSTLRRSFA
jgi:hypothetical protein